MLSTPCEPLSRLRSLASRQQRQLLHRLAEPLPRLDPPLQRHRERLGVSAGTSRGPSTKSLRGCIAGSYSNATLRVLFILRFPLGATATADAQLAERRPEITGTHEGSVITPLHELGITKNPRSRAPAYYALTTPTVMYYSDVRSMA